MIRCLWRLLAGFLALFLLLTVALWLLLLRPVAQADRNDPVWTFNHGSIGNESEQGLPYWIWRVLPTLFPEYLPANQDGLASIGVHWVAGEELPVGFSKKTLGVIPRVAPNCAFCHQGTYRLTADGPPTLVPAGAGTRVDAQAYVRFLARAGTDPRFNASTVLQAIKAIYDMPLWERLLYRLILIPFTKSALEAQAQRFAWTESRPDWGPGRIDPFNPVKFYNLGLSDDGTIGNSDMMPLWGLDFLAGETERTYWLHWDGLLTDLHETVVAGAIGDGMDYKSYPHVADNLARMEDFIRLQDPPPSPFGPKEDRYGGGYGSDRYAPGPFQVGAAAVAAGQALYATYCAACHEPGGARFRTVIPAGEVGTDRHRIDMWTDEARARYAAYEDGYDWGFTSFRKMNGYLANELTGLWLRGPYLHNGSVPTLRDLLAPPAARPVTFYRGWDRVDAANGGFVSQAGTEAERYGWLYDTRVPGNGNQGHLWGTDLPAAAKERLLAYLKTL